MILHHTATRQAKLLSFLRKEMSLSYGLIKRLKPRHAFAVNGMPVHTDYPVRPGDVIAATIEEDAPEFGAEASALAILYEDDAIIALDKPSGIIMHPSASSNTGTLANQLLGHYARTGQQSAIHFVGRLDRDTFGVVLVAKNAHIHTVLGKQRREGLLTKTYHAAVYGMPPSDEGTICEPIARCAPPSLLRQVQADGQYAKSTYQVLERRGVCTLLSLYPETGRTHQLRVHCAHEGFPLLGDAQYGTESSKAFSLVCNIHTQQLCAKVLSFHHPLTGRPMEIHSQYAISLPSSEGQTTPQ